MGCKFCRNNSTLLVTSELREFPSIQNQSNQLENIKSSQGTNAQNILHYLQLSDSLQNQRINSIGPYFDKTPKQSKEKCLEKWTLNVDLNKSDRCATLEKLSTATNLSDYASKDRCYSGIKVKENTISINKVQKAIFKFYRQDPKSFNQLLISEGGGILRWNVWKCKFVVLSKSYQHFLDAKEDNYQWEKQIKKDVNRTFPSQVYSKFQISFSEKFFCSDEGIQSMQLLLQKISNVFPSVGYTQGMNYLIAFILMVAGGDFSDAWKGVFTLFSCSSWMLYALYLPEFPLFQMIAKLTNNQLKKKQPIIYEKLEKIGIDDSILLQKLIMTLYLYIVPAQVALCLWDAIIAKGIWIMVEINVLLLSQFKEEILVFRQI